MFYKKLLLVSKYTEKNVQNWTLFFLRWQKWISKFGAWVSFHTYILLSRKFQENLGRTVVVIPMLAENPTIFLITFFQAYSRLSLNSRVKRNTLTFQGILHITGPERLSDHGTEIRGPKMMTKSLCRYFWLHCCKESKLLQLVTSELTNLGGISCLRWGCSPLDTCVVLVA